MARTRPRTARRSPRIDQQQITEALATTLDREFADYTATRVMPAADDRRGRERYSASLRRLALASPKVGVQTHAVQDGPDLQTTFGSPGDLGSLAKTKFSAGALSPIRLGQGLYDFYPPELPPKGIWNRQPFTIPFSHNRESPANSTILLAVPQVGTGKFFASASTFSSAVDRHAHAWCGTALPIDPNLHDAARGPKDVVVWAEGSITYDYGLAATAGPAWNARPEAATATVYVMARLLRFSRQTGALLADPDAILAHLAYKQILKASMMPNGFTDPMLGISSGTPIIGGGQASYSSVPLWFSIDLANNQTRKLETDSFYRVAVICAVGLSALASGQSIANAQVSALLSLRLVTLGILEHDPKVMF